MGFILISILTIVFGIVFLYLACSTRFVDLFAVLGAIFLSYGLGSIIPLSGHDDLNDDLQKYEKAKAEMRVIQNEDDLPIHLVIEYKNHIDEANKLIEKSAKYHDNWYLSPFYYKEIGELEKLVPDTIKAKSVQIFY